MSFVFGKIKEVEDLPPERRLLSAEQQRQLSEILNRLEQIRNARALRGKYSYLGISSEDFIAAKAKEIELEDRRR